MPRIIKWIGIVLGGIIGLVVVAVVAVYVITEIRLNKSYTIEPEAITIPTDEAAIEHGKHLAITVGKCADYACAGVLLL